MITQIPRRFGRIVNIQRVKSTSSAGSRISIDTINTKAINVEYAVRGAVVARAEEIKASLAKDPSSYPFDKTIACNIGNPQALEQQPISFVRDVLSCVVNQRLIGSDIIPKDAQERAKHYLSYVPSMGAYTESKGMLPVRMDIASFLEKRDGGVPADVENIFLTSGASAGVQLLMTVLMRAGDGILAPKPQYPIYSALSTLLGSQLKPYYLDEANQWAVTESAITKALDDAESDGVNIRGLVVINPGNPTGQVLSRGDMESLITVCRARGVCIMADEVYQENVYKEGAEFLSFRRVAFEMNAFEGPDPLQLASFHSTSKGFLGECGFRGGYMELNGFPSDVTDILYKIASLSLCSGTPGQIITGVMVNPPAPGEESYATYISERDAILTSMKHRADKLSTAMNTLEGVTCNPAEGAMYAFPKITLPPKACEAAEAAGMAPDAFYCMELLNETGVIVVPGSGFGQVPGTWHFRTTMLPPEDQIDDVIAALSRFHSQFMQAYA